MKILWDGSSEFNTASKTYATWINAKKAAEKVLGDTDHRVLIVATPEGRFFPVAIGMKALDDGVHFHMAVTA